MVESGRKIVSYIYLALLGTETVSSSAIWDSDGAMSDDQPSIPRKSRDRTESHPPSTVAVSVEDQDFARLVR